MTDHDPSAEPRWTDAAPAAGSPEARAAQLVRTVGEPDLPSDERMAAIRSRIVLRRGSGRRRARWSLTVALVTGALLIGGTLGAAARGWIEPLLGLRARSARQAAPADSSSRAPNGRKGRVAGLAAAARPSAEPEPPIEPAPSLSPESVPTPAPEDLPERTRRRTARLAGPGLARPLDGASDEARLLGTAIRRLRRDHDARGALAALDQGAVKFSGGQLDAEAALVRVEALLALDDRTGALSLLDGRDLAAGPRARQALELRGELRAGAGRCGEAIGDLERAITSSSDDGLAERGLFARASCFTRLHRYEDARRDLEDYLRRFPDGPRAPTARDVLANLPGKN